MLTHALIMKPLRHINIAFAGKRRHERMGSMQTAVRHFLSWAHTLAPSLRINLMTGLADGADIRAGDALLDVKNLTNYTLTAVLPFPEKDYKRTIKWDLVHFDRLLPLCDKIIVLDGRYPANDEHTSPGISPAECRARAYRQQSAFMLNSCDMLLAITDTTDIAKAGGTIETVNAALLNNIPVVLYIPSSDSWHLLNNPIHLQVLVENTGKPAALSAKQIVETLLKNIHYDTEKLPT